MEAIILARVSTREQEEEGLSLPSQVERANDYAKRKGFDVIGTYPFSESSTKDKRKKFDAIIEQIRNSKTRKALIVECVDRLQRDFRETVMFNELVKADKVELHFLRENLIINRDSSSTDIIRWDMAVMFAKSYVQQIRDNVKRSNKEKEKLGEVSSKAPIGYIHVPIENTKKNDVVPDPVLAPLVVEIFTEYANGNKSMQMLAEEMTAKGLKKGNTVRASFIDYILKNHFYYGEMPSKVNLGKNCKHRYKPLIAKSLYEKALAVSTKKNRLPYKNKSKPFIFKGLVVCANCGCRISPEIKKGKHVYYSCSNAKKNCERVYVNEKVLLEQLYPSLEGLKISDDQINYLVDGLEKDNNFKSKYCQQRYEKLIADYEKVKNKSGELLDLLLDKSITRDTYDNKLKELKEKENDLALQIKDFQHEDANAPITAKIVLNLAQRTKDIFISSETDEKRQLLQVLLQNCKLEQKNLMFTMKIPFDTVGQYSGHTDWCEILDVFRTLNWRDISREIAVFQSLPAFAVVVEATKSDLV